MTTTPNLNITHIVQSQAQKEVTANEASDNIDKATQGMVAHDASSLGSPTEINVTADQFVRNFAHHIIGTPATDVFMYVPDGKRFFLIWNESGQNVVVDTTSGGSPAAPITVSDGEAQLIYSDGTALIEVGGSEQPYDIGGFIDTPTDDSVALQIVAVRPFTIPAGAPGSRAEARVGMSSGEADIVFDIQKNSGSFGSLTFGAPGKSGVFSVASDTAFVAGDLLAIVTPTIGSPSTELVNISITLKVSV